MFKKVGEGSQIPKIPKELSRKTLSTIETAGGVGENVLQRSTEANQEFIRAKSKLNRDVARGHNSKTTSKTGHVFHRMIKEGKTSK